MNQGQLRKGKEFETWNLKREHKEHSTNAHLTLAIATDRISCNDGRRDQMSALPMKINGTELDLVKIGMNATRLSCIFFGWVTYFEMFYKRVCLKLVKILANPPFYLLNICL